MPFDLQPTLRGELLELRPLRAEDFRALYAVASDPLVWEQHPANDRYKEEVFRQFFREALASAWRSSRLIRRTAASSALRASTVTTKGRAR